MTNNPANITGVLTHTNVESGLVCLPKTKASVANNRFFFTMAAKLLVPTSMVYYRITAM